MPIIRTITEETRLLPVTVHEDGRLTCTLRTVVNGREVQRREVEIPAADAALLLDAEPPQGKALREVLAAAIYNWCLARGQAAGEIA